MSYADLDPRERRLVIIASGETAQKLRRKIDWKSALLGALPLASTASIAGLFLLAPFGLGIFSIFVKRKKLPYPLFNIIEARDQFSYPVNHPIDGGVYACCDAEPMLYVPVSSFHRYMYEKKMSAFHQLCANLGVRRCLALHAEEDGKDITARINASIPTAAGPVSVGANGGRKSNSSERATVFLEFPRPNSSPIQTCSAWMNGEPTWTMMQTLRLTRNLRHYSAEFDYSEEFGINGEVAAKLSGIGLGLGGKYEEMKRRKWVFDVEFWPKNS